MHRRSLDVIPERQGQSRIWQLVDRLLPLVYRGGWPARLSRILGRAPAVTVVSHRIDVSGPWNAPRPLKVAFASDFHAGPTTDPEILRSASAALSNAAPDVLLLGGDFVSVTLRETEWLAGLLGKIPAPLGRFAVLGNHDYWNGPGHITGALEAADIQVLTNLNRRLAAPFDDVWICGLDDFISGVPRVGQALAGADGWRIVLMHAPANLVDLQAQPFDLALCGHTHGGQVALPDGSPLIVAPGPYSRRYNRGRYALANGGTLLVTVGLGCSTVPLRVNTAPEVFVVTIGPAPYKPAESGSTDGTTHVCVETR